MKSKLVTFGEVMMRLSPPAQGRFTSTRSFDVLYAGSEANVAAAASLWGIPSAHVTCFPGNDFGTAASRELKQYGVNMEYTVYNPEGRMGVYYIEGGASVRSPKVIYDRFDSSFAHLDPDQFNWDVILDGAEWFHWSGITPAISQSAATACLAAVKAARRIGIKISGDINYRRNLWQYGKGPQDIMPELIGHCDLVVASVTDFENCLGISEDTFEETVEHVVKKYPSIKKVATTLRNTYHASHQSLNGMLWNGRGTLKSRIFDLNPIIDRVGAGDAFMAGLIYGSLNGMSDHQIVDFASAACALKHTVEGDVNTVSLAEVKELVEGENIGKLLR